jgi:secreted PhoX family phosphatase
MKGTSHPTNDVTINASGNDTIRDVIAATESSRRTFLKSAVSAPLLASLGGLTMKGIMDSVEAAPIPAANGFGGIGFESVPPSLAPVVDTVAVPAGYKVEVLAAWGDPVVPGAPAWSEDASQDAAAQAMQFGMHNDGMHLFPFPTRGGGASGLSSERGLLCVNHEYTHEEILHGSEGLLAPATVTVPKVRKSQAAHGISVMEIRKIQGRWTVVRNSPFGRRITGNTPMRVSGPAAGHPLLQSKQYAIGPDGSVENGLNDGLTAFGTLNNCAHGFTPWGTYLTCEENWNGYFAAPTAGAVIDETLFDQKPTVLSNANRYGISTTGFGYRWHEVDPRFNADINPLEPNLFGWVVEIDPFNPNSVPVKRTSMGRFKHESAQMALSPDASGVQNRLAYYMGDDERNEYIYKFVCARPFNPADRQANMNLLDEGILYVAKFTGSEGRRPGSFRGQWIPLLPGTESVINDPVVTGAKLKLRDLPAFKSPSGDDGEVLARILVQTRQAADAVGATMMDRPEWTALRTYFDPGMQTLGYPINTYSSSRPLEVYCTLTNNNRRGGGGSTAATTSNKPDGTTGAGSARPAVDAANPRPDNDYGHIIRWREDDNYVTALGFDWDIFVMCGDSVSTKTLDTTEPGPVYDAALASSAVALTDVYRGSIGDVPPGSSDFGAPDGLWFDQYGRLWIQTDQQGDAKGDWVNIGSNVMCCADPNTKEVRRFMTSPPHCEVTGVVNTPDGRSMFVGIQHPGEDSPATDPDLYSAWPSSQFATNSAGETIPNGPQRRPRSTVLVITRQDGGVVGS